MTQLVIRQGWRSWALALAGVVGVLVLAGRLQGGAIKKHQFEGRCQECHLGMPRRGAPLAEVKLRDEPERLCSRCHVIDAHASHPVGVRPQVSIPLQEYLDAQGRLTCVTCHDVHKEEDRLLSAQESQGMLRGHVQGKAFCATCHREERLGARWRHAFAVSSAHVTGRLTQASGGAPLDKYSTECLSCHDGDISGQVGGMEIRGGVFQHGVSGTSHPVGVEYPRGAAAAGYVDASALPESIQLFDGRVGCLSCHNPYSKQPALLVMDVTGSTLCLACHRK